MPQALITFLSILMIQINTVEVVYGQSNRLQDSLKVVEWLYNAKNLPTENPETALQLREKSLRLAIKLQSHQLLAQSYLDFGISQYYSGNIIPAHRCLDSAYYYFSLQKDTISMDLAWYKKGVFFFNQANFESSDSIFAQGLQLIDQYSLRDSYQIIRQNNALGVANRRLNNFDEAIDYFLKALAYLPKDNSKKAGLLSNLKNLFESKGELDSALVMAYHALEILERENDQNGMIFLLCEISNIHQKIGDFERSMMTAKKALSLSSREGITDFNHLIYKRIGNSFKILPHEYDSALYYHKLALKNIPNLDSFEMQKSWLDIGETFILRNQPDSAIFFLNKLLKLSKGGYLFIHALELSSRANTQKGDLDKAILLADSALILAERHAIKLLLPNIYGQLSNLYEKTGNLEKALFFHKKQVAINDSIFDSNVFQTQQFIEDQIRIKERELALTTLYAQFKTRKNVQIILLILGIGILLSIGKIIYLRMRNNFNRKLHRLTSLLGDQIKSLQQESRLASGTQSQLSISSGKQIEALIPELENLQQVSITYQELRSSASSTFKKATAEENDLQLYFYLVSHDLKNYLLQMRSQINNPNEPVHQTLDQLEDFLQQVGDLSQLENTNLFISEVNLPVLIRDIVEMLGSTWEQHGLKVSVSEKIPLIKSDAFLLRQLFVNLIENAVKYRQPGTSPVVQINCESDTNSLILLVSDNGCGISDTNSIFQPFVRQQMDSNPKGLGLGLAIVKKIVNLHGWDIIAKSNETGTTFYITIPSHLI